MRSKALYARQVTEKGEQKAACGYIKINGELDYEAARHRMSTEARGRSKEVKKGRKKGFKTGELKEKEDHKAQR